MGFDRTALITNIQRFSTDDGPGIRTTVFLKGCTLACKWCHNPETISPKKQLQYQEQSCKSCGACVRVCRSGAQRLTEKGHELDWTKCTGCFACTDACFYGALYVIGREITSGMLGEQLLRDKAFYDKSGGGITLSGGEPLAQADFCAETLRLAKEKGIHTAVDTAGNLHWDQYQKALPWTDLFLFDIKVMDSQKHREMTGGDNSLLLENFKKLCDTGKDIWIRTPLMKEINDSTTETENRIRILKNKGSVKKVELLPYHSYGTGKYAILGMQHKRHDFEKPGEEKLRSILTMMETGGIVNVSIQ
ncbi:glycyl-radical enzyme activating protein [Spirochaetia bacterium]|nr:glycyl-radical enzyme activating protein [Spirochaetia bacterium]